MKTIAIAERRKLEEKGTCDMGKFFPESIASGCNYSGCRKAWGNLYGKLPLLMPVGTVNNGYFY